MLYNKQLLLTQKIKVSKEDKYFLRETIYLVCLPSQEKYNFRNNDLFNKMC